MELRRRRVASYTPCGDTGVLIDRDDAVTRESIARATGDPGAFEAWQRFYGSIAAVAPRLFQTLTEPLRSREAIRRLVDDAAVWRILFEDPLAATLEPTFSSDLVRGVVLTDATIGTFAPADDPLLRQNRCFLYHVIGNGTGRWDVPVGGMGALSDALAAVARRPARGSFRAPRPRCCRLPPTEPRPRSRARTGRAITRSTCSPTSLRRCCRGCWDAHPAESRPRARS